MKTIFRFMLLVTVCVALLGGARGFALPHSAAQATSWSVKVFDQPDLTGTSVTETTSDINYTWGAGAPVINGTDTSTSGIPTDQFSVRFTSSPTLFAAGTYRFTLQVDDGARLFIDGMTVLNAWTATGGINTLSVEYTFPADGNHALVVEMFDETGDSSIVLTWTLLSGGGPAPLPVVTVGMPWTGEFFNNLDMTGAPVFTLTYPPSGLNLNWGLNSPSGSVQVDNFTARFTRPLNVPAELQEGVYIFHARADDNFRFLVDSTVIMDQFGSFANSQTYTAEVTLLNGPHLLTVEYRELTADASLFLTWDPPYAQNPTLPVGGGAPTAPVGGIGGGGGAVVPPPTPLPSITASVNVPVLNFRDAPSYLSPIQAKLNQGESYPVSGRTEDSQWVQLTVNGVTGWSAAQYLTLSGDLNSVPVLHVSVPPSPPPPPPTSVRGVVLGNLRIRELPTTRSAQIGLLPWNTEVGISGKDGGHAWYMVTYNGITGWSYAPWIKLIQGTFNDLPYTDGTQPIFMPPPATEGVVIQAFGNVRIRSGPGLQYPKLDRVVWGNRVQVLARSTDGKWYKVKYGGIVGWTYANWYSVVQGDMNMVSITNQ